MDGTGNTDVVKDSAQAAAGVLYGKNTITLSDGREVDIKKVTLRSLPAILTFAQVVLSAQGVDAPHGTALSVFADTTSKPSAVLQLIANNLDGAYDVIAMHCSLSKDELLDLDLADSSKVIREEVRLNKDFFMQEVWPLLAEAVPELGAVRDAIAAG